MLNTAQLKLIRSLHTKKGREKSGRCLVEGTKCIETAGTAVEFTFRREDAPDRFDSLVTTETPQEVAGVARIPQWTLGDVSAAQVVVVLDGVQDPGNVGSVLRLCLGFNAALVSIDSVDVTNPKVVRSSVGALFAVPWVEVKRADAAAALESLQRPVLRLELVEDATPLSGVTDRGPLVLVAGSEGAGITLPIRGTSVRVEHSEALESLNVTHAVAIALHHLAQL